MNCEEVRDKLDAHLLDALEEEESNAIEEHLKSCQACRQCLVEAMQSLETLRSLPGIIPGGGYADRIFLSQQRRKKFLLSLLTGAFVLLFLLLWLLWSLFQYRQSYSYYHLKLLENAIYQYHFRFNAFPKEGGKTLGTLLLTDFAGGPYISSKVFLTDSNGAILDPWGIPYIYHYPGKHNRSSFDLYSCGRNRKDEKGRGDDLRNWK